MFLLAISILSFLAFVNYRIGKGLFYPSVVFCSVWAGDLIMVWLSGDFFYPLSPETLLIICSGCVVFSIGVLVGLLFPQHAQKEKISPRNFSRILDIMVFLAALGIPFCFWWISRLGAQYGGNFFAGARVALPDPGFEAQAGTKLFNIVVSFSSVVAILAFCEKEQSKSRSSIAVAVALLLNLMTGGRSGATALVFTLICIDWMKNRRLSWKPLLTMSLIFVTIFTLIAVFVFKGDARPDASLRENTSAVVQGFVLYAGGGLVGFDRVVRDPHIIPHNWQINRFFLQVANALGAKFEVPSLHAEFVNLGPNSLSSNVYTFYFAYIDWGYFGMAFIVMTLGFVGALWYKQAVNGNRVAIPMYGMIVAGLMLSIFNEFLFFNLNFLLRLYLISWYFMVALPAAGSLAWIY